MPRPATKAPKPNKPTPEAAARQSALETVVAIQADQLSMLRDRQREYVREIDRLKGVVECLGAEVQRGSPITAKESQP